MQKLAVLYWSVATKQAVVLARTVFLLCHVWHGFAFTPCCHKLNWRQCFLLSMRPTNSCAASRLSLYTPAGSIPERLLAMTRRCCGGWRCGACGLRSMTNDQMKHWALHQFCQL